MRKQLCDFGDVWIGGYYSSYYHTFLGKTEYWLCMFLLGGLRANIGLPVRYYGLTNCLGLYLTHWGYSPFVDHQEYKEKRKLSWPQLRTDRLNGAP